MKTILVLILTTATASAQSITNGQSITFTNNSNRIYDSVRVERIEPHGIIWFTSPTVGGFARFAEMPDELRARFGVSVVAERAAIDREQLRQAARAAAVVAEAKRDAAKPEVPQHRSDGASWAVMQWLQTPESKARIQQSADERVRAQNFDMQMRGAEWRAKIAR